MGQRQPWPPHDRGRGRVRRALRARGDHRAPGRGRACRSDREQAQVTRPLTALVMGGCLLRRPLKTMPNLKDRLVHDRYGIVKVVHSVAEMIQVVEFLKGTREIPPEIRVRGGVGAFLRPLPEGHGFHDLDVVLAEPSSPVDITFRGFAINRAKLGDLVLTPIEEQGPAARKLAQKWVRLGLMEMKEETVW